MGIVFESRVLFENTPKQRKIVDVFEATTLYENPKTGKKIAGVQRNRMSDRLKYYDGNIWWLPLKDSIRSKMNVNKLMEFLLDQSAKPYDMPQAIKSALDRIDNLPIVGAITYNIEDYGSFFCSELASAALEFAGAFNNVNASVVTPIDLCMFDIYDKNYHQLSGAKTEIVGYNTVVPDGFGM